MPLTHPPYAGLVWAIGLIVFSLALSAYGLYLTNRRRSDALAAATATASRHEAKAGALQEQVETLTKERDRLR